MRFLSVLVLVSVGCASEMRDDPNQVDATTVDAPPCPPADRVRLYPDVDGDGFGDAQSLGTLFCAATSGYVVNNHDCADGDVFANPSGDFSTTKIQGSTITPDFDFNCDGTETPMDGGPATAEAECFARPASNCGGFLSGWFQTIPACGVSGHWNLKCVPGGGGCIGQSGTQRVQACK